MTKNFFAKIMLLALVALAFGMNAMADNVIKIADFNVVPGGASVQVEVEMDNEDPISSLQFDLILPEGLTYNNYSRTDRMTNSSHAIQTVSDRNTGIRRFLITSNATDIKTSALKGNSGAVLKISLSASSSFSGGEVVLKDIVGSNGTVPMPQEILFADAKAKVIPNAGTFALGSESVNLRNGDDEAVKVDFSLSNQITTVGLQAQMVLPEGVSLEIEKSDRLTENVTTMAYTRNGVTTILLSSLTSDPFVAKEGVLFSMLLKADKAKVGKYDVELKDVLVSNEIGKAFALSSEKGGFELNVLPSFDFNNDGDFDIQDVQDLFDAFMGLNEMEPISYLGEEEPSIDDVQYLFDVYMGFEE